MLGVGRGGIVRDSPRNSVRNERLNVFIRVLTLVIKSAEMSKMNFVALQVPIRTRSNWFKFRFIFRGKSALESWLTTLTLVFFLPSPAGQRCQMGLDLLFQELGSWRIERHANHHRPLFNDLMTSARLQRGFSGASAWLQLPLIDDDRFAQQMAFTRLNLPLKLIDLRLAIECCAGVVKMGQKGATPPQGARGEGEEKRGGG